MQFVIEITSKGGAWSNNAWVIFLLNFEIKFWKKLKIKKFWKNLKFKETLVCKFGLQQDNLREQLTQGNKRKASLKTACRPYRFRIWN